MASVLESIVCECVSNPKFAPSLAPRAPIKLDRFSDRIGSRRESANPAASDLAATLDPAFPARACTHLPGPKPGDLPDTAQVPLHAVAQRHSHQHRQG